MRLPPTIGRRGRRCCRPFRLNGRGHPRRGGQGRRGSLNDTNFYIPASLGSEGTLQLRSPFYRCPLGFISFHDIPNPKVPQKARNGHTTELRLLLYLPIKGVNLGQFNPNLLTRIVQRLVAS
ncbi:protein of unknown function [Stenotrophomonas maltophilia]|nr:protein of unknown function [Stenotrophomonas maltophilia]